MTGDGSDDCDDPQPPTPAAPALALVVPSYCCATCQDTGRVEKPSTWVAGRPML